MGIQWGYSGNTVGVEEPHNNHVFKDNMLEMFVSFKFGLLLQSKCWWYKYKTHNSLYY